MNNIKIDLIKEQRKITISRLKRNYSLIVGGIIIFIMVSLAVFAPILTDFDPYSMNVSERLKPPSSQNILGTDEFGRDLLTRVLYGARVSITVGLIVSFLSSLFGLVIGLYSCYNNFLDSVFMRICDGLMAIPGVLLAIALMSALGASIWNVILALTIVYTPSIARVIRSGAIVIKEQPYIEAVKIQGAGHFRILWINIFPNVISPLLIQISFVFASAILSEAALSFLGIGIPPTEPSWGNILQSSRLVLNKAWWMAVTPGFLLVLSVLGLNLLGDGLRDYFDPH